MATALFGPRLHLAVRFADWLAGAGVERGLLGPREVPRLWERHLLNCAVIGELIPQGSVIADIGSGAGLPGLALAIARPDLTVILIEPLLRRTIFLDEVVADLGLQDTVQVRRLRAEQAAGLGVDVVTSRAVATTARLSAWSLPLLRPGGTMLAVKGSAVADELAEARTELRRLGAARVDVVLVGSDVLAVPTTVLRAVLGERAEAARAARGARAGRGSTRGTRGRAGDRRSEQADHSTGPDLPTRRRRRQLGD